MLYRLLCLLHLTKSTSNQLTHLLTTTQNSNRLLVLVRVDLDLVNQLLVYQLVLVYQHQQTVQLTIQLLVLVQTNKMLLPQLLLLTDNYIQLVLFTPNVSLHSINFARKLFSLCDLVT